MRGEDREEAVDVTGLGRPECGCEDVTVLTSDAEAELLGEVIPVEQLDRIGEAALAGMTLEMDFPRGRYRLIRSR